MTHLDFNRVAARHDAIDARLSEWARWVKVSYRLLGPNPMWKNYKTSRQWDIEPSMPIAVNTLAAHEVEKAVSAMPTVERTILRWAYVWPGLHPRAISRETGVHVDALPAKLESARELLIGVLYAAKD